MDRQTTVLCMSVALGVALLVFAFSLRGAYRTLFVQETNTVLVESEDVGVSEGAGVGDAISNETDSAGASDKDRFGATAVEIRIVGEDGASADKSASVDRSKPYDKSGLEPVHNIEGIDVLTAQILDGMNGIAGVHDDTEKAQSALKITNLMDKETARAFIKDTITLFDGELWEIAYGALDDTAYADSGEIDWMLALVPVTSFNDSQVIVFTLNLDGIVRYEVY